jgi:hypothetical protein
MRIALAFLGAALMVAGMAARIVASRHAPGITNYGLVPYGWPATTYDLVRIGGWALLIFGAVTVAFALIREFRKPTAT